MSDEKPMGQVIQIDEARTHLFNSFELPCNRRKGKSLGHKLYF